MLFRHVLPNIARAADRQRDDRRRSALLAFAGLSFLGLGRSGPQLRLGAAARRRLERHLHPPGRRARARGSRWSSPGWRSTCSARPLAKGIGHHDASAGYAADAACGGGGRPEPAEAADPDAARPDAVLEVQDLAVGFPGPHGPVRPVRGVSFRIGRGEAVGVVGESGLGQVAHGAGGRPAHRAARPRRSHATALPAAPTCSLAAPGARTGSCSATSFAMVFQDPMTSLNPTQRDRRPARRGRPAARGPVAPARQALARAVDRLRAVRVPAAERRAGQYPHEFSGGMRQRAMIGMGVMGQPALIVADEPTTALDVTVQRQVLRPARVDPAQRRCRAAAHQPRRRRHRPGLRPGARHVRRPDRRGPARRRAAPAARGTRTRRRWSPPSRTCTPTLDRPLAVIPGRPVDPARPAGRLRVRAALPAGRRALPRARTPRWSADGAGRRVACWHAGEDAAPTPAARPRSRIRSGGQQP